MSIVCLDEADELLQNDFIEQIQNIFQYLNKNIQILLFSATIPYPVFQIMQQFMVDPVKILVKKEKLTLVGIRKYYVDVGQTNCKWDTLIDLYGSLSIQKAIIFASHIDVVDY